MAALVLALVGRRSRAGARVGAFAAGLLAVALARSSAGTAALAAFCAWQMSAVWTGPTRR